MRLTALLSDIDRLLHTKAERTAESPAPPRIPGLLLAGLFLGVVYGACMGLYALLAPRPEDFAGHHRWLQFLATSLKLPLVFLLTYGICTPSLYVFATLAGSRERPAEIVRLLLARNAECLAVLASLGPITAFFTLSTESYPFMKLLNVVFLALGGSVLVVRLRQALLDAEIGRVDGGTQAPEAARPTRPELGARAAANRILSAWLLLLAVVGGQVAWILRPFLGAPDLPFALFRSREDSFYLDVLRTIGKLLS